MKKQMITKKILTTFLQMSLISVLASTTTADQFGLTPAQTELNDPYYNPYEPQPPHQDQGQIILLPGDDDHSIDNQWDYHRGPAHTAQWIEAASHKVPKLVEERYTIQVHNRLVNEIVLRASDSRVQVSQAIAFLSTGEAIELRHLNGTLRAEEQTQQRVDRWNSLRIEKIVLTATSPKLSGTRGRLSVLLGLAE